MPHASRDTRNRENRRLAWTWSGPVGCWRTCTGRYPPAARCTSLSPAGLRGLRKSEMQVAGIRRTGDRAERIEAGELRPLPDDWVRFAKAMAAAWATGMSSSTPAAGTWIPGCRRRSGCRQPTTRDGSWPRGQRARNAAWTNPHPGLSPPALAGNSRYARAFPCRPVHSQPHLLGREDVDESFGPASVVLGGYGRRVGAGTWSDLLSGLTPRLGCLQTGPSPGSRSFRHPPALPVRSAWPGQEAGVSQIGGQRVRAIPQTTEKGRQ